MGQGWQALRHVTVKLTDKQNESNRLLAGKARHVMLFGGSRSGKTFVLLRAIAIRAIKAPGSRHAVLRFRFNAVKASVVMDTWPKMMQLCFPKIKGKLNKEDWFYEFENGSQVWFGGLDEKERTEKILGQEYATIFFNECSQIPWNSIQIAQTRLAQRAEIVGIDSMKGEILPLKFYYDENPPDKSHWSYKLFKLQIDPETRKALNNPADYDCLLLNPDDNRANLPAEYIKTLEGLSERMRRRFLRGEFRDANPHALFPDANLDQWRVTGGQLPEFVRVVVAVDPSGSSDEDNRDNDAIGIVVTALGTDGIGYLLEDLTIKAGPATWGKIVVDAYERHEADMIVAEINYGGAMVREVIRSVKSNVPYKEVRASRGKIARADPISALVERGQFRLVGYFPELEEELGGFTTNGFLGGASPNRADAMIWGASELFPGIIEKRREQRDTRRLIQVADNAFGF